MIRVQRDPFDTGAELNALLKGKTDVGAAVTFTGLVRDFQKDGRIQSMTLEHYPGMTENELARVEKEAHERWPLGETLIIHRYGRLEPGDPIVLVITTSAHRGDAFAAAEFLMDYLKTKAPFWKLEDTGKGSNWVEARESDDQAAARWQEPAADAAQ